MAKKDGEKARGSEGRKCNLDASIENERGGSQPEMSNCCPERLPGKHPKTKSASENDLLVSFSVFHLPPFRRKKNPAGSCRCFRSEPEAD